MKNIKLVLIILLLPILILGILAVLHINNIRTIISPLLDKFGIYSSCYENCDDIIIVPVIEESTPSPSINLTYKNQDYSFSYKENWNLIEKVDTDRVGPNSIYLGALELEIPSTINSEFSSSIYVKVIDGDYTLDSYLKEIQSENTKSPSEYFEEESNSEISFGNLKGHQIIATISDGEELYIKQDIFTVKNNKVYRITFFASEKEYDNLKSDIENFIHNFYILK